MKLACTKDPTHRRFVGPVMVRENWLLDANGRKLDVIAVLEEIPITKPQGIITCAICGGEAEVDTEGVPVGRSILA